MASSSAIGPGPSDIGFGADPGVRNLAPRSFEGKDCLGEAVGTPPQPCVETVIGVMLLYDHVRDMTSRAKQLKVTLTSVRTLLVKRTLHDHLKEMSFRVK